MISLDDVNKNFGGLSAVSGLCFNMGRGGIFALIGPNGAGKTTVFNLITGIYKPTGGSIRFMGSDITGRKPYQINRLGIARTFQNIRLFPEMTVAENIRVGRRDAGEGAGTDGEETIDFLGLREWRNAIAREIPYGLQRRLEIARALATGPKLLLLDEPSCGMNEEETKSLMGDIARIRDRGCTILMVEHDMDVVMGLSDRIVVLNFGRKIAEGTPSEIKADPLVQEAYLGGD